MANLIGAKDKIERALVQKYATVKMDNPDAVKLVDSQKMLDAMNDYAMMSKNMLDLQNKLKNVCAGVTQKSVVYLNMRMRPSK